MKELSTADPLRVWRSLMPGPRLPASRLVGIPSLMEALPRVPAHRQPACVTLHTPKGLARHHITQHSAKAKTSAVQYDAPDSRRRPQAWEIQENAEAVETDSNPHSRVPDPWSSQGPTQGLPALSPIRESHKVGWLPRTMSCWTLEIVTSHPWTRRQRCTTLCRPGQTGGRWWNPSSGDSKTALHPSKELGETQGNTGPPSPGTKLRHHLRGKAVAASDVTFRRCCCCSTP